MTTAIPARLTISAHCYQELFVLVQWLEAMPGWFDINDHQVDAIHEHLKAHFDALTTEDFWVGSVEIEDGSLVAICETEGGVSEVRVPVGIKVGF